MNSTSCPSAWKEKATRKPLVLQGARQTGKTWLLKYFGSNFYESVSYFNFEKQVKLGQFFETSKDTERIIENLSLADGKPILPGKTLIIFDEIQESNNALISLKYFYEEATEYHIACAGSLLGVAMSRGSSFPVGHAGCRSFTPSFPAGSFRYKRKKPAFYRVQGCINYFLPVIPLRPFL